MVKTSSIKSWFQALRLPFLSVTILSVILGTILSQFYINKFQLVYFILALIGACFFHLGANLINDYFDAKNGTDAANKEFIHPFTGGSRVIQNGQLNKKSILISAIIFFIFGSVIGIYFGITVSPIILYLGIFGLLSAVLYSAILGSYFVGELLAGISFGSVIIVGSFIVQTGFFRLDVVIITLPIAFLVSLILWINQFPDYKADKQNGKLNLVVRFGRRTSAKIYLSLLIWIYTAIIGLAFIYKLPNLLFALLTIPLAINSSRRVLQYYDRPAKMLISYPSTILLHTGISLTFILVLLLEIKINVLLFFILTGITVFYLLVSFIKIKKMEKMVQHKNV